MRNHNSFVEAIINQTSEHICRRNQLTLNMKQISVHAGEQASDSMLPRVPTIFMEAQKDSFYVERKTSINFHNDYGCGIMWYQFQLAWLSFFRGARRYATWRILWNSVESSSSSEMQFWLFFWLTLKFSEFWMNLEWRDRGWGLNDFCLFSRKREFEENFWKIILENSR